MIEENPPPPPPRELELAWYCERYKALPDPGGILDQDAGQLARMAVLSNVYSALTKLRNAHGEQIHSLTESERAILKMLVDLELIFV